MFELGVLNMEPLSAISLLMGNNNQMNSYGAGEEAPMETNQEMQGILEEDETRINVTAKDVKDDPKGDVVLPDNETVVQKQPPPPPPPLGPIVRWERFLPVRSLNVLLVENDDSTRQLVSALLRNCSYEVTAAADALQAWRILEDLTNRVDLILTEVNIPGFSGIGLLCKIMSHRTCKNIPVIMMASNDSVGTVFKCLSKGAVDFLVKPIRKNELKNLWQHVWRRCHSSSGSGSENGIQHQKSTRSMSPDDSDDNTDSDDEDDNGSFGQNLRDGSDNVSETQSSWTKHAVEDDSPQQMSPSDPWADPYDITCAQVIHSKHGMPKSTDKECREQKEVADKNSLGKDLEKEAPQNPNREQIRYPIEKASSATGASMERLPECNPKVEMNENVPGRESSNASCGPITQVADLIDGIADNCEACLLASRVPDTPDGFFKISKCKDKANEDSKELPTLELSLKRLRSSGDGDDHNILRRSDFSAFSRYNSPNSQAPTGRGPSCSNPHDSSDEIKSESTYSMLNAVALKQGSNGSSNNNDMGSTTKDAFTKLLAKEKITSTATAKTIYPSTLRHTPHRPAANQPPIREKVDDVAAQVMTGQARGLQHEIQVQRHHHHYHHHHHHVHSMQQQQSVPPPDRDDISLNNMVTTAPQCGSSNMFPGSMEINVMNYSLNGSASGSNHMSNGHNGSSKAVNTGTKNMESDAGAAANGEAGGTNLVDQNRFLQREAALNKFRQKRKERNFGKKVRYQSRKRLAEQRPLERGQFVRRTTHEHTSREGSS